MEGIRMYKEKQKVGFGMNYTQSRELKENNRIYREMESIYHEICVKAGISDTDFIVLYSIVEFEDGCCQRKIAKQYSISRQTVNSSVKKLVQNGCVVLESGKGHDKQIVLTEKGKAMAKQKIIPVMEAEAGVFMHMTEDLCDRRLLCQQQHYLPAVRRRRLHRLHRHQECARREG